jgi:hypothetical protein
VALEIKSYESAGEKTKGIHLFNEEYSCKKNFIVSRNPVSLKIGTNINVLPWQDFCGMLWDGLIL